MNEVFMNTEDMEWENSPSYPPETKVNIHAHRTWLWFAPCKGDFGRLPKGGGIRILVPTQDDAVKTKSDGTINKTCSFLVPELD